MPSQYDPSRRYEPVAPGNEERAGKRPLVVTRTPLVVWIVSDALCRVRLHWSGSRTFGCYLMHGSGMCPGCNGRWPVWDSWYLTVAQQEGPGGATDLLGLTKVAVESCPEISRDDGYLWGRRIRVWRHPGGPKDPMYAEIVPGVTPRDLPRAEDTMVTLIRLWQSRTRAETLRKQGLTEGRVDNGEMPQKGGFGA